MDIILDARVPKSEAPSITPAEERCWMPFSPPLLPPPPPRDCAKRHQVRDEDESRAWKTERNELEAARRASLIDEEYYQLRVLEVVAGHLPPELWRLRGALLMVLLLLRTPLMVSLLHRERGSRKPDPSSC